MQLVRPLWARAPPRHNVRENVVNVKGEGDERQDRNEGEGERIKKKEKYSERKRERERIRGLRREKMRKRIRERRLGETENEREGPPMEGESLAGGDGQSLEFFPSHRGSSGRTASVC